jgi:dynein heavy chain
MNKIIFDKNNENNGEKKEMIPGNLTLPPRDADKEAPYFGMVPIPQHDFPEQFSNFCFNSLYIKEEVIHAMVEIRTECNNLLESNSIFDTAVKKTIRLEEFRQLQNSSISQIKYNTKDQWVSRLEKIIKNSFSEVGKGWFNIHETSKETYEFGKLKKFLTVVNFMMQDGVLCLCQDSVAKFVDFILKYSPKETIIKSASDVTNIYEKPPKPERIVEDDDEFEEEEDEEDADQEDPIPLFVLDLILKPGQMIPQYSTDPADIVSSVLAIFDSGTKSL